MKVGDSQPALALGELRGIGDVDPLPVVDGGLSPSSWSGETDVADFMCLLLVPMMLAAVLWFLIVTASSFVGLLGGVFTLPSEGLVALFPMIDIFPGTKAGA